MLVFVAKTSTLLSGVVVRGLLAAVRMLARLIFDVHHTHRTMFHTVASALFSGVVESRALVATVVLTRLTACDDHALHLVLGTETWLGLTGMAV